jgi:hypothetical protein
MSKLYTEKQVLDMLKICWDDDLYENILTFSDILKTQKPIHIPNDEEISEKLNPYAYGKLYTGIKGDWELGAEAIRDYILRQCK